MANAKRKPAATSAAGSAKGRELIGAEKLFHKERRSAARFSHDDMWAMEAKLNEPEFHFARRVAFGIQAMSGNDICTKIETDRAAAVAFAEAAIDIREYVSGMRETANFIAAAELRIVLLLCVRQDMEEILATAAKRQASGE